MPGLRDNAVTQLDLQICHLITGVCETVLVFPAFVVACITVALIFAICYFCGVDSLGAGAEK